MGYSFKICSSDLHLHIVFAKFMSSCLKKLTKKLCPAYRSVLQALGMYDISSKYTPGVRT